jgi:hypothetical protein
VTLEYANTLLESGRANELFIEVNLTARQVAETCVQGEVDLVSSGEGDTAEWPVPHNTGHDLLEEVNGISFDYCQSVQPGVWLAHHSCAILTEVIVDGRIFAAHSAYTVDSNALGLELAHESASAGPSRAPSAWDVTITPASPSLSPMSTGPSSPVDLPPLPPRPSQDASLPPSPSGPHLATLLQSLPPSPATSPPYSRPVSIVALFKVHVARQPTFGSSLAATFACPNVPRRVRPWVVVAVALSASIAPSVTACPARRSAFVNVAHAGLSS